MGDICVQSSVQEWKAVLDILTLDQGLRPVCLECVPCEGRRFHILNKGVTAQEV